VFGDIPVVAYRLLDVAPATSDVVRALSAEVGSRNCQVNDGPNIPLTSPHEEVGLLAEEKEGLVKTGQ
jgi:hypothetical protein